MLLSPEYNVVPRLCDVRDVHIKFVSIRLNDLEFENRAVLRESINNLTDITREGMEKAIQAHHDGKIWLKPGATVENGASSAWDVWIERSYGAKMLYMTINLYRK